MPPNRPHVKRQRSVEKSQLLCGLALIAASISAAAQEPDEVPSDNILAPGEGGRNIEASVSISVAPAQQQTDPDQPNPTAGTVADEEFDAETLASAEAALNAAARLELEIMLGDYVRDDLYDEAIPIAERLVEATEEEFGDGLELGIALSNLAILQRRLERFEPSEENFIRAVDTIREAEGIYHEAVITPLIGLGINYRMRGDPLQAAEIFEEARTVNRRVYGLMNESQIDILDHITSTFLDMERYEEADAIQLEALNLRERIYGPESMEILPAIYKFAAWLRSGFRFQEERDMYSRAMNIIRDNNQESSLEMVRALRELGNSFRVQKYPEGRGIGALRRALEIAESQPVPDRRTIAEILVDIGDWNTAFSKVGPTGDEYRQAWALLGDVENGGRLRQRWFDEPEYVLRENPSNRGVSSRNDPDAVAGYVLVHFDVTAEGRTENVTVVDSDPPGLKDASTARAINRSRFRPRMVDGEPVASEGQARNFTFYYVPQD